MQIFGDFFSWSRVKLNYKEILSLDLKKDEVDIIRSGLLYST